MNSIKHHAYLVFASQIICRRDESFARYRYLLSESQEAELPKVRIDMADMAGNNATIDELLSTMTLISAAKTSAVEKWVNRVVKRNNLTMLYGSRPVRLTGKGGFHTHNNKKISLG